MTSPAPSGPSGRQGELGAVLVFGFATAVSMWCLWLITHHPAVALPASVIVPLLLACLTAGTVCAGRFSGGASPWLAGLGAGLMASLLNILILIMLLVRPTPDGTPAPGFEGLTPSAAVAIAGFLALGAIVGLIGGAVGGRLGVSAPVDAARWLARFAVVAALAVAPLLLLGGAVTSTSSGMAVRGWPDSYGANMFLYPIALMGHPRVFLEHSHRLFGALVGLTTLSLLAYTLAVETRRRVKWWAVGCAVLVCVQGIMGGLSVLQDSPYLRAVHGVVAQIFFAMMVALAAYLSPLYQSIEPSQSQVGDRKRKTFSGALLHSTIVQLIFGALYRHVGQIKGSMHALWAHMGFSVVVVVAALMAGFALRSCAGTDRLSASLRRLGTGILAVMSAQFILGWITFLLVLRSGPRGPAPQAAELETARAIDPLTALVATIHQGNGALLLALATLAVVFTRQLLRTAAPGAPVRAD